MSANNNFKLLLMNWSISNAPGRTEREEIQGKTNVSIVLQKSTEACVLYVHASHTCKQTCKHLRRLSFLAANVLTVTECFICSTFSAHLTPFKLENPFSISLISSYLWSCNPLVAHQTRAAPIMSFHMYLTSPLLVIYCKSKTSSTVWMRDLILKGCLG